MLELDHACALERGWLIPTFRVQDMCGAECRAAESAAFSGRAGWPAAQPKGELDADQSAVAAAKIRARRPEGFAMSRMPNLSSPFLLGFDEIERALDKVTRAATDGYPPYNIERIARDGSQAERLRITLAVAGFTREQLEVSIEEGQLVIRGRQQDEKERQFLHRGIAARQFQRVFLLADGMQVAGADLTNGLLSVDLVRPEPVKVVKKIDINVRD